MKSLTASRSRSRSERRGANRLFGQALSRGDTLVELLVTLGLVSVVILAAAQLIGASARVYQGASQRPSLPGVIGVTASLRQDVQGASGVILQPPSWDQHPMELLGWDGGRIRYWLDGEALVREAFDGAGAPTQRRVIANGVASWWWRLATPRTVEVRVSILLRPGLRSSAIRVDRNTVQRRFTLRGWPDGRSW